MTAVLLSVYLSSTSRADCVQQMMDLHVKGPPRVLLLFVQYDHLLACPSDHLRWLH